MGKMRQGYLGCSVNVLIPNDCMVDVSLLLLIALFCFECCNLNAEQGSFNATLSQFRDGLLIAVGYDHATEKTWPDVNRCLIIRECVYDGMRRRKPSIGE